MLGLHMKNQHIYYNCAVYINHPEAQIEPISIAEDYLRALEAYNRAVFWILDGGDLEKIGSKAACLWKSCQDGKLPETDIFKPLETLKSQQMAIQLLGLMLGLVLNGQTTFKHMGSSAVSVFHIFNPYLRGEMNLDEVGDVTNSTKQAVSKKQLKFLKKLQKKFPQFKRPC